MTEPPTVEIDLSTSKLYCDLIQYRNARGARHFSVRIFEDYFKDTFNATVDNDDILLQLRQYCKRLGNSKRQRRKRLRDRRIS